MGAHFLISEETGRSGYYKMKSVYQSKIHALFI